MFTGPSHFWDGLYSSLKTLEPLVTNKERILKYRHTCTDGTPHEEKATELLTELAPNLYDKRSGEVFKFCRWLNARFRLFMATWCAAKYQQAPVQDWEGSKDFSVKKITKVCKSCVVAAHADFVVVMDRVLQEMVAWCERCPCHDLVQKKYGAQTPWSVVKRECGDFASAGIACVNRGCRAPEVAAGALFEMLDLWIQWWARQACATLAMSPQR